MSSSKAGLLSSVLNDQRLLDSDESDQSDLSLSPKTPSVTELKTPEILNRSHASRSFLSVGSFITSTSPEDSKKSFHRPKKTHNVKSSANVSFVESKSSASRVFDGMNEDFSSKLLREDMYHQHMEEMQKQKIIDQKNRIMVEQSNIGLRPMTTDHHVGMGGHGQQDPSLSNVGIDRHHNVIGTDCDDSNDQSDDSMSDASDDFDNGAFNEDKQRETSLSSVGDNLLHRSQSLFQQIVTRRKSTNRGSSNPGNASFYNGQENYDDGDVDGGNANYGGSYRNMDDYDFNSSKKVVTSSANMKMLNRNENTSQNDEKQDNNDVSEKPLGTNEDLEDDSVLKFDAIVFEGISEKPSTIRGFSFIFNNRVALYFRRTSSMVDLIITFGVICILWFSVGIPLGILDSNEVPPPTDPLIAPEHQNLHPIVLSHLHIPSTVLSMIGSGGLLFAYFYYRSTRNFIMKLVGYLSLSDLGLNVSFLIVYVYPNFCFIQGAMSQFFPMASMFWTFFISFTLVETLVKSRKIEELKRFEIFMHIVSWFIPGFFSALILILDWSEIQLSWCWIKNERRAWRLFFFYYILAIVFIYNLLMYIIIFVYSIVALREMNRYGFMIRNQELLNLRKKTARAAFRFAYYLLAFFVTWAAGLAHRVYNLFDPRPFYPLIYLHTLFVPLQGFSNFLAYGASYQGYIRKWIKTKVSTMHKRLSRKKREEERATLQAREVVMMDNDDQEYMDTTANTYYTRMG